MNSIYKLLYVSYIYAHQSFIKDSPKENLCNEHFPIHQRISIDESMMNTYIPYYHIFTIDIHQFIKIAIVFPCLYPLQLLSICQLADLHCCLFVNLPVCRLDNPLIWRFNDFMTS